MRQLWWVLSCTRSDLNGRMHARARCMWPAVLVLLVASLLASASIRTLAAQMESVEDNFTLGLEALQRGSFETAVQQFSRVVEDSKDMTAAKRRLLASVYLARAQAELGGYRDATSTLEAALALAQSMKNQAAVAAVLASLGEIQLALSAFDSAQALLTQALEIARAVHEDAVAAGALNSLGTLYLRTQRTTDAIAAYQQSEALASKIGQWPLAMGASVNVANALRANGQATESRLLLDRLLAKLRTAQPSHEVAYRLIGVGTAYRKLGPMLPQERTALLIQSAAALSEAATIAERLGDHRAASHAWGGLGSVYESEGRDQESLRLTRSAIRAAQHVNAPELLYQWQWQAGRVLVRSGAEDEALLSYRQAVNTVQSIRAELTPVYEGQTGAFRERMAPLYLELVDLVLRRAASARSGEQLAPILREARETIELFKVAELRDYFHDDCVDRVLSKSTRLETISSSTAIIYPISLPDRVELLVSFGGELKQFTVPVRADVLAQTIATLRDRLEKRTTREFLPYAQRLYAWLIQPLERELAAASIETLIFVPDGALRTIPMGALHDGRDFLISKFAIGITPSLYLTDPAPLRRDHPRVLAAGLTEAVQGFPPLVNVAAEIQGLQRMYGARALLDGEFALARLERELKSEKFSIVHIASHGQFDSRADDTFVLAFDGKLTLDRLNHLVGMFKYRDEPIELLTLSACDTAAGDDRAALGLAGIAVKAGARSALATLWNVNDAVSTELVLAFYRELGDASVSRAQALRRAQLKVLSNPRYDHPGYWSAFVLINNWL